MRILKLAHAGWRMSQRVAIPRSFSVSIPLAVTMDYISAVSGSPYFAH